METALPVEILLGLYLGLLTGIVPALASGILGFSVRYFTGVSLPGFGVVVLALSIASVNGGLLGLVEPTIAQSPRLLVAVVVVLMLSLYAHNQGDTLGQEIPRHVSFSTLRRQTLSADVVEFVGGMGRVTVRPSGEVHDLVGYPPLSQELRESIRNSTWEFPAELPLSELETRLETRLRSEYDLAAVSVTIDAEASASIAAAPPIGGLSRRVPSGHRAVSLSTLVPAGLASGEVVDLVLPESTVSGTVLSVASPAQVRGEDEAPTTVETRLTVAVPRRSARTVLEAQSCRVVVQSRGASLEFEAVTTLQKSDIHIRSFTLGAALDRATAESILETGVVMAVRASEDEGSAATPRRRLFARSQREPQWTDDTPGWTFGESIEWPIGEGSTAFVAGPGEELERLEEEVTQ